MIGWGSRSYRNGVRLDLYVSFSTGLAPDFDPTQLEEYQSFASTQPQSYQNSLLSFPSDCIWPVHHQDFVTSPQYLTEDSFSPFQELWLYHYSFELWLLLQPILTGVSILQIQAPQHGLILPFHTFDARVGHHQLILKAISKHQLWIEFP